MSSASHINTRKVCLVFGEGELRVFNVIGFSVWSPHFDPSPFQSIQTLGVNLTSLHSRHLVVTSGICLILRTIPNDGMGGAGVRRRGTRKTKRLATISWSLTPSLTPHTDTFNYFNRFRDAQRCAEKRKGTHAP